MSITSKVKNWWRGGYLPAEEAYPDPLTSEQLRMISLSAPLQYSDKDRCNTRLCPLGIASDVMAVYQLQVKRWGSTPDVTMQALNYLSENDMVVPVQGQEQTLPLAWRAGNIVDIARFSFVAKYIDEPTAWRYINHAWELVKDQYGTWREYGEQFALGNRLWWEASAAVDDQARALFQQDVDKALQILLDPNNPESPWNKVAFKAP